MMGILLKNTLLMGMAFGVASNVNMAPSVSAQENGPDIDMNEAVQPAGASKPNIVLIVLDDMGFSDLGCYGAEVKTPNIDKLAENGIRYNNFNVCPMCSPTRAALLTGRDNNAVGMGLVADMDLGPDNPKIRGRITPSAATIAQILGSNGYSTLGLGKWHLVPSHQITPAGPFENWPMAKGFERYYGFLGAATDQFNPQLVYDNHMIDAPEDPEYHISTDLVDHAEQFIDSQVSVTPDKPFFLYLSFGAVHSPHQVPEEYIEMYRGAYSEGWDRIRQERFQRQKELGIVPADAELTGWDSKVQHWESLSVDEKRLFERFEEVYAGFVTHTDDQVGRLIAHLKSIGKYENTIFMVISDNGATNVGGSFGTDNDIKTLNGVTTSLNELLPLIDEVGGQDMEALYPNGWALVSNTPFRGYKMTTLGGGTRVPLIVCWPGRISADGATRSQYVHVTDITPTILDVLDIEAPEVYHEIDQMPIHGVSMAATFQDPDAASLHEAQYYNLKGNRSIYSDGWKAIAFHTSGEPFDQDAWELYNLDSDYSESRDLSVQYPEKLKALEAQWWTEAETYGGLPLEEVNMAQAATFIPAEAVTNRTSFKYYPGMEHLGPSASASIRDKSYSITVPITRAGPADEGVLVALGGHMSGYTLYVQNNRLVYEYNFPGLGVYKIVSNTEVPTGESILKFEFTRTGPFEGTGRLYINDMMVGETPMPRTVIAEISFEGFDVGMDRMTQVSKSYREDGEFPFAGTIEYVLYESGE